MTPWCRESCKWSRYSSRLYNLVGKIAFQWNSAWKLTCSLVTGVACSSMTCRLFYNMYFSGCLHKCNTKVAFILIFKVAALNAYIFGILNVNQQRKHGFVCKVQEEETEGLCCIPSTPIIWLCDLGPAVCCALVNSCVRQGDLQGALTDPAVSRL